MNKAYNQGTKSRFIRKTILWSVPAVWVIFHFDLSQAGELPPIAVQVTASSELPYEMAVLAADGDTGTFWMPERSGSWLQIRFDGLQTVSSIQVEWAPAKNCDYTMDLSMDAAVWTTVATGAVKSADALNFPLKQPQKAQYLRIRLQKGIQGLSEIRINGQLLLDPAVNALRPPVPADAACRNPALPPEQRAADVVSLMAGYEKHQFVSGYRSFYIRPLNRFGLRAVYLSDATGGVHLRPGLDKNDIRTIAYPSTVALAATWNANMARQYGDSVARECRQTGADILLGPGFNLYRNSCCGRNFEYMGEDPVLTADMAVSYIEGMQSEHVMATAKHFICNNHEWLRHTSDSVVDSRALHELYMYPWYFVVHNAHVGAVMTSYNLLNGEKASQSATAIHGLLQTDIGFNGLTMSDWGGVTDPAKALVSGQDLVMPQVSNFDAFHAETPAETVEHLNSMCTAILTQLFRFGIYDRPRKDPAYLDAAGRKACEEVALNTARESITLLKNDGVLPLPAHGGKILLIGPDATNTLTSGWGSGHVDGYDHTDIAPELQRLLGGDRVQAVSQQADDQTLRDASALIVCADLNQGEGKDHLPELPNDQQQLIRRCTALNPRTVVVVCSGGGVQTDWSDKAAALVWTYFSGQYGGRAIAEVLAGTVNPSGRLPYTLERRFADSPAADYKPEGAGWSERIEPDNTVEKALPAFPQVVYREGIFIGYRWYDHQNLPVSYPFGFGLSYTTFKYSGLQIQTSTDGITIQAQITNCGKVAGKEVVQLYVGEIHPAVTRPPRELKAFMKIELAPGETKPVKFQLKPVDLAYYDVQHKAWRVEPDEYTIGVAASSRDIRLSGKVDWKQELYYTRPTDQQPVDPNKG